MIRNAIVYGLLILLLTGLSLNAQVTIKPHYGYWFATMDNANNLITQSIEGPSGWRAVLGEPVPHPGQFDGNRTFGLQLEYHGNEDLFVAIQAGYFDDEVESTYANPQATPPWDFLFRRKVRLYDVMLNLHYYPNYSSWRRFNYYLGLGVGWMNLEAISVSRTDNPIRPTDSRGEYNRSIVSGSLTLGANFRLVDALKLWAEGGYQYGNFGRLDGTITTLEITEPVETTTETEFDLSGLFVRGGVGFSIPFLR